VGRENIGFRSTITHIPLHSEVLFADHITTEVVWQPRGVSTFRELYQGYFMSNDYSLHLRTTDEPAVPGTIANVSRSFPQWSDKYIRIHLFIKQGGLAQLGLARAILQGVVNITARQAGIQLDYINRTVKILNGAGNYEQITELDGKAIIDQWQRIVIVLDWELQKYLYLEFDDVRIDISSISLYNTAAIPVIIPTHIALETENMINQHADAMVDDILITGHNKLP